MGAIIAKALGALLQNNINVNRLAASISVALAHSPYGLGNADGEKAATWSATFSSREDAELFAWAIDALKLEMESRIGDVDEQPE